MPEANVISGGNIQSSLVFGLFSASISVLPSFSIKANSGSFTNSLAANASLPLNIANIQLESISGLNLIGASANIILSSSFSTLYTAVANVSLASGEVTIRPILTLSGNAWLAGTYTTTLEMFAGLIIGVNNRLSPSTQTLSINVPAVLNVPTTLATTSLAVNSLGNYRQGGVSINTAMNLSQTVPVTGGLKTNSSTFSFSSTSPYKQEPSTAVSLVKYIFNNESSAVSVSLNTTSQTLNTVPFNVLSGNQKSLNGTFSISSADLKSGFIQAGTYSVPIVYAWDKPTTTYPTGPLQKTTSSTFQVVVNDMGEIAVNQTAVILPFNTASDYQAGVTREFSSHLTLSKTTPYNVYVKASSSSFTSGSNTIPLNILEIGPMNNQTGVNTVVLSSTPALLINNADPVIDREVNLFYRIPASKVSSILGKPNGAYSTSIVYSFVAQ